MAKHKSGELRCPATALIAFEKILYIVWASFLNVVKERWSEVALLLVSDSRLIYEPPHGKTNNVVSDQVRHKPTCTSTEDS